MDKNNPTTKYTETLKHIKLSETSRARMAENLSNYVDFHAVQESANETKVSQVRESETNRSREQVSPTAVWYTTFFKRLHLNTMPLFTIVAMLLIGGGSTLAAQSSLPGELLYPVKVGINENVRLAFAVSNEAETEVQLALLEERVREAQALKAKGRLDGELALAVNTRIKAQAKAANEARSENDAVVAVEARNVITAAITRYNTLIGKDSRLTIANLVDAGAELASRNDMSVSNSASARTKSSLSLGAPEADMGISTMLAVAPAPMSVLYQNAQIHLDALVKVLERHRTKIEANQYAEFRARLDNAAELMGRAYAQSNENLARPLVEEATEIIGSVEAALTLLGEATIDTETGAILDIDFSRKPGNGPSTIDIMPMPPVMIDDGGGQTGFEVDAGIDNSNDMLESSLNTGVESRFSF